MLKQSLATATEMGVKPSFLADSGSTYAGSTEGALELRILDARLTPWVPLAGCGGPAAPVPSAAPTRGAAAAAAVEAPMGLRYMCPLLRSCEQLLTEVWEHPEAADAAVSSYLGSFLVLEYLANLFRLDLDARLQVRHPSLANKSPTADR